jgi:hypothetical protein
MPRALIILMRLQARALLRRTLRGARKPRGIIFLTVGIISFMLWLGPSVLQAVLVRQRDPMKIRALFPVGLLAFCLINLVTTAGERAVAFSPAEVDLLFPGPFTRRQLLGYKIVKSSFAAMLTSIIFSVFLLRYVQWWMAGFIGVLLSLIFLQLLSMSVVFVGQTIGERAYTRGRKLVALVIAMGALVAIIPLVQQDGARSASDVAMHLRQTQAGRIILAPFDVFGRVVGAQALWPELALWTGAAVLVILGMLALVFWLDTHYLETAAATSQRLYDQVRRVRRAGGIALRATGSSTRRVPMFPRLGGAGPIAWRQLTAALRQSRAVIVLMVMLGAVGGPIMYFATRGEDGTGSMHALVGVIAWMTFLFANALRFDFRGDVDLIDTLKALPVGAPAIAAAQHVAPTIVLTVWQARLIVGHAVHTRQPPEIVIAAIAMALPFNLFLFAIENLIFLLFPARLTGLGPGDFQSVGRQVVVLFVKVILLLIGGGFAIGLGMLGSVATHGSKLIFALTSATILLIETAALLPLLVSAFRRFDPSTDVPPG